MSSAKPAGANGSRPAAAQGTALRSFFSQVPRLVAGILLVVIMAAVFAQTYLPEGVTLDVGSVATQDFLATRTAADRYKTNEARQRAADAVPNFFRFDPNLAVAAGSAVDNLAAAIRTVLQDATLTQAARIQAVAAKVGGASAAAVAGQISAMGAEAWSTAASRLRDSVVRAMSIELDGDAAQSARTAAAAEIAGLRLQPEVSAWLVSLSAAAIEPTLVLDVAETDRRRTEAMNAVAQVTILKDQIIARRGDVLTAHQITLLQDFGMMRAHLDPSVIAGSASLALVMVGMGAVYVRLYEPETFASGPRLLLLAMLMSLVLLASLFTKGISSYLAPVAAGTMLVASLVSGRLAMVLGFIGAVSVGIISGGDMRYVVVALTGGFVGVYSLVWVGQRSDLTRAGVMVGLANVLATLAMGLLYGLPPTTLEVWRDFGFAFANGILSAILTIGTLPFFESSFGLLTSVRLLEYANPNQPLLRRLLIEAPGTYHHSIMVGNLSEAAADAVGANALLARVGAYYHDVGKVVRPYFYIENQLGQTNPHDSISPSLSALIITSHVKDGVTLTEEAKLPARIIDFVRSHHGTSLVSYFYSRATESGSSSALVEADFRYDGPLPQTKEEAIVMLADSTEAAVRSMREPTPVTIEALVRRLVRDRLADGQLEKCDLTLRDLDRICETFVRVLLGIFHVRIEYPQDRDALLKQIEDSGVGGPAPAVAAVVESEAGQPPLESVPAVEPEDRGSTGA